MTLFRVSCGGLGLGLRLRWHCRMDFRLARPHLAVELSSACKSAQRAVAPAVADLGCPITMRWSCARGCSARSRPRRMSPGARAAQGSAGICEACSG